MNRWIALAGFVALTPLSALACDCMELGKDFWQTVARHNEEVDSGRWPKSMRLTIVEAEVERYLQLRPGPEPTEMVLRVNSIALGSDVPKELIIEGDNGGQCREYVTSFPIGRKYLFALTKENKHFAISSCGYYAKELVRQ